MSSAGLSNARVARLHDVMASYVERGEVPGLVTLVSRRGETHIEALGMKALGGSDPVQRDTIFRIAPTLSWWLSTARSLDRLCASEPAVEKIKSAFVELASMGGRIDDGAASFRRSGAG
jgi:hypothetical protein